MNENSSTAVDRNFDDLAHRFQRNVYSSLKGSIRLEVLKRDLEEFLPPSNETVLQVLDAGGGQGQMSIYFARQGHQVLLCDISEQMLAIARQNLSEAGLLDRVALRQLAIQELLAKQQTFDVVVCHAVLEWAAEPERLLKTLVTALKPGASLSLIYYNLNGLIYKNLLRNNFRKIRSEQWQGHRGSLTPPNPLRPEDLNGWLQEAGLEILCESGIRVFHDYILDPAERDRDPEGTLEMELRHSRLMPFKYLGRYIHVLCRKPVNGN